MLKDPQKNKKKFYFSVSALILTLLFIGAYLVYSSFGVFKTYKLAKQGKESLESIRIDLKEKNLGKAKAHAITAVYHFEDAERQIKKTVFWKYVPWVSLQIKTVEDLAGIAKLGGSALYKSFSIAEGIKDLLGDVDDISYSSLTPEQKQLVLQKIVDSISIFEEIDEELSLIIQKFDAIPEKGLHPKLEAVIAPVREKLPDFKKVSANFLPLIKLLPEFVGYEKEKNYLFLLQNSNELRPTGGFIGTYGIIKMHNAEILDFFTDNIYNIDVQAEEYLKIASPEPLKKYLYVDYWYLRDSNWSPDFIESAEKAIWFYRAERGPEKNLDGVIAITPEPVMDLMKIVGKITVDGIEFTSDNVQDKLENRVGKEFYSMGISMSERKEVVGNLGRELLCRLFGLPTDKWGEVIAVLFDNLEEKHFLIYSRDPAVAYTLRGLNWDGKLIQVTGDYLMVVDANMASLKTDTVIDRDIKYSVTLNDNMDLIAEVDILYKNQGDFTWKTTRLRTYTRVYVPLGSELLETTGLMYIDRSSKPGEVEVYSDLGRTVFAGFISIEPKEEKHLTFRYKLPDNVKVEMLQNGLYKLYVQKQPGTMGHDFELHLDLGEAKINNWAGQEFEVKAITETGIILTNDLRIDRIVNIEF